DLNRYVDLVPSSQRAQARAGVQALQRLTKLGKLPVDVWVDSHHLVRREAFSFPIAPSATAGAGSLHITADLYDYGPQPPVTAPPASQVFDASSLVSSALSSQALG